MNWTFSSRATLAGLVLLGGAQAQAVGTLYAGFGGASDGVSIRSANTLTETGSFGSASAVEGIAAGESANLYIAGDDSITNVSLAGGVLATETVADAGYTDAAVLGANLWVAAAGTPTGLSQRDLITLAETNFISTAFTPTSIEDGFGRLYVTSGDTLFVFSNAGVELANTDTGTAGVTFVESALSGTRLYAVTGGTADGVSVRNPITLAEIPGASFSLPFAVEGIVAGDNDDLFLTSGGNVFHYSTAGVELGSQATGRALTDITFIADPLPPATGTALAISADAAGNTVAVRDAATLAAAGSFDILGAASGITTGAMNDTVYLAIGDTLAHYGTAGALLGSVTEAGTAFTDVAFVDGDLIATVADGFSVRDANSLAETAVVTGLGFDPISVSNAGPGEIYLTAANVVYRYTTTGTQLASFASNDQTFIYTDVALVSNVVYAVYNSPAQDGISVLDPSSLLQADVIPTTIAATGIGVGSGNDYYISGGNTVQHYALDEVLATFTAGAGTTFPDVVFSTEGSSEQTSLVAALLPSSRSVQVGNIASAFATVINTGPVTASNCRIEPAADTNIPGTFSYQTTDGGTNELVGMANTPVDIAASNGLQSFFFQFVPSAPFAAMEVALDFECTNAPAAPVFIGLNTLLLSADTDPVPDVIALAATPDPAAPGIVNIPGVGETGFFSVSSVNVGIEGEIAVTAAVTDGDPNVSLTICETDPATGMCINPATPTSGAVNTTIGANATPTFSIFATASGSVALDPAGKRLRVLFADQTGGAPRGATSVAVRTQ